MKKPTDTTFRNAKAKDKPYKVPDMDGLYLYVKQLKKGVAKYWRFDYRIAGKRKTLSIGKYPIVTLAVARERLEEAKRQLEQSIDPSLHKKMQRDSTIAEYQNTFEAMANEWFLKYKDRWSTGHASRVISYLKKDVYPWIGERPINTLRPVDIIEVVEKVSDRGAVDAARRVKGFVQQVFAYAVIRGRAERNICKDIDVAKLLPPRIKQHYPTILDPVKIGELMRAIDNYQGSYVVRAALKMSPLVMLRPTELRGAEWREIDLESATWVIPARRMKFPKHIKEANRDEDKHIIPLSRQAVEIFAEILPLTGKWKYVFPNGRGKSRPLSENGVRTALRTMGYSSEDIVPHGFRSMASSLLNESGQWNPDAVERQLSHRDKNVIRRSYNHAEYLPERREMLQYWADYLDKLKAGADILPFKQKTG